MRVPDGPAVLGFANTWVIVAVARTLSTLPDQINVLRRIRCGPDAGIADGAWGYAVVAILDDANSYLAYHDHPTHVAVLRDFIAPITSEAARTHFESGGDSL